MKTISPILNNSKSIFNGNFFVNYGHFHFPENFVAQYLAELLKLTIIDATEKAQIEEVCRGVRGIGRLKRRMDKMAVHFPALFKRTERTNLAPGNQAVQSPLNSHQALNKKLEERLARHEPSILSLGDFIEKMNAMVLDKKEIVDKPYHFLACYAQIFTFCPKRRLLIPLLIKKALETGQVDLASWCTNRLKAVGFDFNGSKKLSPLLDVALDCLENYSQQTPNKLDPVFLENWDASVQLMLEAGASFFSKRQFKFIRVMLGCLIRLAQSTEPPSTGNEQPGSEVAILDSNLQPKVVSLISTLLLLEPLLPLTSSKSSYLEGIIAAMLQEKPYSIAELSSFFDGDVSTVRLKLFYPTTTYYSAKSTQQALATCLTSDGFFRAILDDFLPRYSCLTPEQKGLSTQPSLSKLLDWLGEQAFSENKKAPQLIDMAMSMACSDVPDSFQASWEKLSSEEIDRSPRIQAVTVLIMQLIKAGIGLSYVDAEGMTLSHKAALHRWPALARVLLEAGLDINVKTLNGHTALHLAITEAIRPTNEELVKLLVKHPTSKLHRKDKHGWTPLHHLVMIQKAPLLDFFIQAALEKKCDLKPKAKMSWRMHAPLQGHFLGKIVRAAKMLMAKRFSAIELAEQKGFNLTRDRLMNYNHQQSQSRVSNHPEAYQTAHYQGKMPNSQEIIEFIEQDIEAKGDCAFLALGVSREEVQETLMNCASLEASRNILAAEIISSFVERIIDEAGLGNFSLSEGEALYKAYSIQEQALGDYIRQLDDERLVAHKKAHPEVSEKNIPALSPEEWPLYLASTPALENELNEYNLNVQAKTDASAKLQAYASSEVVYRAYVSSITKGMYLGFASILLYAKEVNWSVYIWRKGDKLQGEEALVLSDSYQAPNPSSTVHLLHTGGYGHFNRLDRLSSAKVKTSSTAAGHVFSVETSSEEGPNPNVQALHQAIQQLCVVKTETVEQAEEATKDSLGKEQQHLQAILSGLLEHQETQKIQVEARLKRIENLLEENLLIAERYKTEVGPYPLRRSYYQRLRAEIAINFSAVLLLSTKLIQAQSGKVGDACASHSSHDALLNITVPGSEVLAVVGEGATFLAEHAETALHLIKETLKIGAKKVGHVIHGIPVVGQGISSLSGLVGDASRLAEFYGEHQKIERAHDALLNLSPKEIEQWAEKIALIMTARVKDVLEEVLTVEGVEQLAFFDYRRLLLGLLEGSFEQALPLEDIIANLCEFKVKQGRFCSRIPLTGKAALRKDQIVKWLKVHQEVTVEEAKIPASFNENYLHHGVESAITRLCKQEGIVISKDAKTEKIHPPTQEVKKETQPLPKLVIPRVKAGQPQPSSTVKETAESYNRFTALEQKSDMVEKKTQGLQTQLNTLDVKRMNELSKLKEKNINLEEKITTMEQNEAGTKTTLKTLQMENARLEDKITRLEQQIDNQKEEKKREEHERYYSDGREIYQQGKADYNYSLDATLSLEDRRTYWSSSRPLFSQAKMTLKNIDLSSLQKEDPVKAAKIGKKLEKCTFFFNSPIPQATIPAEKKIDTTLN